MKNITVKNFLGHLSIGAGLLTALLLPLPATSEVLDLPSRPFDSSGNGAKPNFLYVLDNSSSMNLGRVNDALDDDGQCKVSTKDYNDARKITGLKRDGTTLKINAENWWEFNQNDIVFLAVPEEDKFSGVYKITKRNYSYTPAVYETTGGGCVKKSDTVIVKYPYCTDVPGSTTEGHWEYPSASEAVPYYVAGTVTPPCSCNGPMENGGAAPGVTGTGCWWTDPADLPIGTCTEYAPTVTTKIKDAIETAGDYLLEVQLSKDDGKDGVFKAKDIVDAYILPRSAERSKCVSHEPPAASNKVDGLFYDPTVRYQPPPSPTGLGLASPDNLLPSMNRANTGGWTKVRADGTQLNDSGAQISSTLNINQGVWRDMVYCDTPKIPEEFLDIKKYPKPYEAWFDDDKRCKRNDEVTKDKDKTKSPNYPYHYPARTSGFKDDPSVTYTTSRYSVEHQNHEDVKKDGKNPVAGRYAFGITDDDSAPFYYNIEPIEYCTDAKLQSCRLVKDGGQDATYRVPSYVRYCKTDDQASNLTTSPDGSACQWQYNYGIVDSKGVTGTYRFPRYGSFERVDVVEYENTGTHKKRKHGKKGKAGKQSDEKDATYYKYPDRKDCTGANGEDGCSYDEEMTNVANWLAYYSNRIKLMKSASAHALTGLTDSYRVGFMTINRPDAAGNYLPIADFGTASSTPTSTQKKDWLTKLYATVPNGYTPLREALSTAGQVFAGKHPVAGYATDDPMQYSCQQNFTLLTTDGYWNGPFGGKDINGAAIGNLDGVEKTSPKPKFEGNVASGTLADVAKYYYDTDIRDGAFGNSQNDAKQDVDSNTVQTQKMKTYTLGLGVDGELQYPGANYDLLTSGDFYDLKSPTDRYYWDDEVQKDIKDKKYEPGGYYGFDASASITYGSDGTGWLDFIKFEASTGTYYMIAWWSTAENWPVPVADRRSTVDDLWHAAVNSDAVYYSAKSADQLKDSLEKLLVSIGQEYYSGAPPAVSNIEPAVGDYAFSTSFVSKTWTGNLAARELSTVVGEFYVNDTAVWCADAKTLADLTITSCPNANILSSRVTASTDTRKILMKDEASGDLIDFDYNKMSDTQKSYFMPDYLNGKLTQWDSLSAEITAAGGDKLVKYLRGQTGYEDSGDDNPANQRIFRDREVVLGDITDSDPVHVGKPLFSYTDGDYLGFKTTANRAAADKTVYVGANDGMLHAFNATDGSERWAFIPSPVLPKMYKLADQYYTSMHANYVNGDLVVGDICNNPCTNAGDWSTILVGGLAQGGRGYYALDITDPINPTLLWEFTNVDDPELGYTYGKPVITKKPDGTWVVLVTSGYNNGAAGRLYVLRAKGNGSGSADKLAEIVTAADDDSGLAQVSAFTKKPQTSNTSQYVYGGDLLGNLWKFDIVANTVFKFAKLIAGDAQPITAAPVLAKVGTQILVMVGTGKLLEFADLNNSGQQTLYAIRDANTGDDQVTINDPRSSAGFVQQVFTTNVGAHTRTVTNNDVNLNVDKGWYIDLTANERQTVMAQMYNGVFTVATSVNVGDACSPEGYGWKTRLNYLNGKAVDGTTSTSVATYLDRPPTGLVNLVHKDVNGDSNVDTSVFDIKGKDTGGPPDPLISGGFGGDRFIWRELIVD